MLDLADCELPFSQFDQYFMIKKCEESDNLCFLRGESILGFMDN